jgi:hypothetical protein
MTTPALYSLAYFSTNAIEGTQEQVRKSIEQILLTARRNNVRHGITGALLFSDGCFAQVLEGARDDIEAIFETIQCDARHRDVTVMHLHPVAERSFGAWSMAFAGVDGVSIDPGLTGDAAACADAILASAAGQNLLAALRGVVHRDDLGRRGALTA